MRRVVVTGMGIACPLGLGVEHVWRRLINGESGITAIQAFDAKDLPCKVAGQVPNGTQADGRLDIGEWIPVKDVKKMDRFIHLALVAATEAVEDSGWQPGDRGRSLRHRRDDRFRHRRAANHLRGRGRWCIQGKSRRLSPFFIPSALINLGSGHVSIKYGFKGPNHSAVTACATGVHAIGDAARLIMWGDADVMVAGGAEAAVCELGVAGFCASRALSTGFNDRPAKASRPWDKDRDGFVMGEGAGVVVLEEYEHAKLRGAKIYAEVAGYGMSGDAYHITAPAEGHDGAFRSMRAAMKNGGFAPEDIQYVNAHGTSTPLGDDLELEAVERLFGDAARQPGDVVHQVRGRPPAGRGRRGGGDLLDPGDSRRRGAADAEPGRAQPRQRHRPRRQRGAAAQDPGRAVQQFRLRRHQRLRHLPRRRLRPPLRSSPRRGGGVAPACRWRCWCCWGR